jgi:hypothetical protein
VWASTKKVSPLAFIVMIVMAVMVIRLIVTRLIVTRVVVLAWGRCFETEDPDEIYTVARDPSSLEHTRKL